jgi:hypothetical protein
VVFVTPLLNSTLGLPPSTIHDAVWPLASFTSIVIHECGLMSSTLVTTPCSETGFDESNSAENEW